MDAILCVFSFLDRIEVVKQADYMPTEQVSAHAEPVGAQTPESECSKSLEIPYMQACNFKINLFILTLKVEMFAWNLLG